MKRALLIIRLPFEVAFGLLYMSGFLVTVVEMSLYGGPASVPLGFLGMPRRINGLPPTPSDLKHIHYEAIIAGLLFVMFLLANGLLWFKDVYSIIQKLRRKTS